MRARIKTKERRHTGAIQKASGAKVQNQNRPPTSGNTVPNAGFDFLAGLVPQGNELQGRKSSEKNNPRPDMKGNFVKPRPCS